MNTAELPRRIDEMVTLLRSRDEQSISLVDVATVTGVLISTMQAYFTSIDTKIYSEFASLSDYIEQARKDIAALAPDDLQSQHIPRAGQELDAIVEATEDATNTIMSAAEEIMSADPSDAEAFPTLVNDAVMRIFEACSFQDITGQRISKVVETFTHIEQRLSNVSKLIEAVDGQVEIETGSETDAERRKRELMLNGPQLKQDAADQAQIDLLMAGDEANGKPVAAEIAPVAETAPVVEAEITQVAETAPVAETATLNETDDISEDDASQADIDAMFS